MDTFRLVELNSASAHGIAAGPRAIIAVGEAIDSLNIQRWITRRSTDGGEHFQSVETGLPNTHSSIATGVAIDSESDHAIYVVGGANTTAPDPVRWIVRKSTNLGQTWSTVDDVSAPGGAAGAIANGVAVDREGVLYVTGIIEISGNFHWITRRSENGGTSWTTVDDFQLDTNEPSFARAVTVSRRGAVFVAGTAFAGSASQWLIRYSSDGISGWKTIDSFGFPGGLRASANGIGISPDGRVTAVGGAQDADNIFHWIVRAAHVKDPEDPEDWETIDDFVKVTDKFGLAEAFGVAFARDGETFVTGSKTTGLDFDNSRHFILTRAGNAFDGDFKTDDLLQSSPTFPDFDATSAKAAVRDAENNIYTAGGIDRSQDNRDNLQWIIRKLDCE